MGIDEIMDMLDWNNDEKIQQQGINYAKSVKCINAFIQPCHPKYCKNVWDNCALILAERPDDELTPYLPQLFDWLVDINWPGAYCVFNRLLIYKDKSLFNYVLYERIKIAKALNEDVWLETLLKLQ